MSGDVQRLFDLDTVTKLESSDDGSRGDWTARPDLVALLFDHGVYRREIWGHVADIMFDPQVGPDPGCVLCVAGISIGAWSHWMVGDPFSDEDQPDEAGDQ